MVSEERWAQQASDGYRADAELQLTERAFTTLEQQYIEAWKTAPLNDDKGRERLWQAVQILGKVQSHLRQTVANGRIAEADLKRLRTGKTGIFS